MKSHFDQYLQKRKQLAADTHQAMLKDYQEGIRVIDIAAKYTSPKTNKPYHAVSVHRIIRNMLNR